jgi:hypothetical protein
MGHEMREAISEDLIERLETDLGAAIEDVRMGKAAKRTVSLSFEVGLDEDAKPVVIFAHKQAGTVKGS